MKRRCRGILIGMSVLALLAFGPKRVPVAGAAQADAGPEARQARAAREQAGNVLFVRPPGWKRQDSTDGTVMLVPPGLPQGGECALVIIPGGELQGSLRDRFNMAWQALLTENNAKVVSGGNVQTKRGDGFDVISTAAVVQSAAGERTHVALFMAAPQNRVEAVAFFANSKALYEKYLGALTTLWETIRFANLQPGAQPMAGMVAPSSPVAPSRGKLQVESMYIGLVNNPQAGSGEYRFDFLIFYTNGFAYRGGGGAFKHGPGFLELNNDWVRKYDLGTYKRVGNEFHITWPSGGTQIVRREGKRLNIRGAFGESYERLPKVDGLRLQGTYVAAVSDPADPAWVTFASDGSFRDRRLVFQVSADYFLERGYEATAGGVGTYTIQDYSLTLRHADGQTSHLFFFIHPDDDPKRPKKLRINTYLFELQQ